MIERAHADPAASAWRMDAVAESLRHPLLGPIDDDRIVSAARAVLRTRRRCVAVRVVTTIHSEPAPF